MPGLVVVSKHAGQRCEHGRKSHWLEGGTQDMLPHTHSSLLSPHSSAGCGAEPCEAPTGTQRVWWQCWGQGGCALMGHNSPLRRSLSFPLWQFHPEDAVRTCPTCLALLAMTPLL